MKRILCLLLAALLLTASAAAALAEGADAAYAENGITVHYTDEFDQAGLKGVFYPLPEGILGGGIGLTDFLYFAIPADEFTALLNKSQDDWTEQEIMNVRTRQGELFYVLSIDSGRGPADLIAALGIPGLEEKDLTEIGRAGDTAFYCVSEEAEAEAFAAGIEPEYREEFLRLREALRGVLAGADFTEPVAPGSELIGQTLSFETTDLDGNPVKSSDIFSQNRVTMVNFWQTWCGPCKNELAELAEMNRRLQEKGAAVIGVCMDADTKLEDCRTILEERGVDYLNLMPFADMGKTLGISSFPTSYFMDSEGKILKAPFIGAPAEMSAYESVIDSLLAGEQADNPETAPVQANGESVYRVYVSDSDGDPVASAMVQFCSDTSCMFGKTDENGLASFEAEKGAYTVHMLKVPEGYEMTNEEFRTMDDFCDVYIVLRKAN